MEEEKYKQLNLFNFGKEYKKIKKPIRLIEFFAGIGAQAKSLDILGIKYESHKICEWAANSIIGYNAIHNHIFKNENHLDSDFLANELFKLGVSIDYNQPAKLEQLKRLNNEKLNFIYESIHKTNNLVNIMNVHGEDLEIEETDKYEYVLTYSFPCQDLSNAGAKKGCEKGSNTRSALLWEVDRILKELASLSLSENKMPILIMENVPDLVYTKNIKQFNKWRESLEELGYTNYVEILNAKDYGAIPQNRKRVFMVSINGDFAYDFPIEIQRKHCLKDMLDSNVDEKYFLSEKTLKSFMAEGTGNYPRKDRFVQQLKMANSAGGGFSDINNERRHETNGYIHNNSYP